MNQIPIYKAERDDGLADLIRTKGSISYASQIEVVEKPFLEINSASLLRTFAENQGQIDLFYLKSILVSIGWNLNDDVFGVAQTWAARHTPEDKPFNLEHNPRNIVGHITNNYGLSDDGKPLDDSLAIDELPDKFHIVTSAVLYKFTKSNDKELEKQMEQIIAEIKKSEWYVSMEALFADFDYAVYDENTTQASILPRNKESAFLTKHLRAYGGDGIYQGKKVGRFLKDIVFAGKGLVRRPANPASIIFKDVALFKENSQNLIAAGYKSMSDNNSNNKIQERLMADVNIEVLQNQIKSLESSLTAANNKNADFEKRLKELDEQRVQARVAGFETEIKNKDEKIAALTAQVQTEQTARTEAEKKLKDAETTLAKSQEEFNKVKAEQTKQSRLNKYISQTGATLEVATKALDKGWVSKLTDEEFDDFVKDQPKVQADDAAKKKAEEDAAAKQKADDEAAQAAQAKKDTANALDNADKSKNTGTVNAGVNKDIEKTRKGLSSYLGKTYLNRKVPETNNK
jgi:chemotaxis protein histidine kinase CheA